MKGLTLWKLLFDVCVYMYVLFYMCVGIYSVDLTLKRGWGCLMTSSCLESQGCHLIPLSYLLSCFFCLVLLLVPSCDVSANGLFS